MKRRTREQVETAKQRAERFLRNVLDDDERADEVADESVDSYAERKHIEITNPQRSMKVMATKQELAEENEELRAENEELQARLDQVMDIVAPDGDGEADEDEDDDEADDDDEDDEDDDEAAASAGELAAASVPPGRPNGRLGDAIRSRNAQRKYEKAVAQQAVANARVERARRDLGK